MNFVAIDVETANRDIGSICQIGLAKYMNGELVDTYCTLVNPRTYFNQRNIEIHRITSDMVLDAPLMTDIYDEVLAFIGDNIVVSHTYFDRRSMSHCFSNYDLIVPKWPWVDSTILVRRTHQRFAVRGYNLANVCKAWSYQFAHHDALEDAKACGFITITILRETSTTIGDWLKNSSYNRSYRTHQNQRRTNRQSYSTNNCSTNSHSSSGYSTNNKSYPSISAKQGNEAGRYAGLNICFTGNLSISRENIIEIAADNGFNVKAGASKKLDYLVVSMQDSTMLMGHEKSSKQRKVEALIEGGVEIKIIEEQEFLKLIEVDESY